MPFAVNFYHWSFAIYLEGNIGTGKSSVLARLSQQNPTTFIVAQEPVDKWQNFNGQNLLQMAYEKKNMYLFQTFVLLTQAQVLKDKQEHEGIHKYIVSERSLFSNRYCFTELAYHANDITKIEIDMLDEWF